MGELFEGARCGCRLNCKAAANRPAPGLAEAGPLTDVIARLISGLADARWSGVLQPVILVDFIYTHDVSMVHRVDSYDKP